MPAPDLKSLEVSTCYLRNACSWNPVTTLRKPGGHKDKCEAFSLYHAMVEGKRKRETEAQRLTDTDIKLTASSPFIIGINPFMTLEPHAHNTSH
jgi:hypothetical protein